jgi:putative peptide zinc metalloprotease protein
VAFNAIFIAGVSSLLFNGNPLLRYDAYYILTDLLEIPNLGPRGNRYFFYLVQRYLFGMTQAQPSMSTPGERFWFIVYTVASFFYRMLIYASIVLFVASKFFFIGVLFACLALINMFIMPALKGIKFLVTSPRLNRRRFQAITVSLLFCGGLAAAVALAPVPLSTMAEGAVWIPEKAFVRAGTAGFIDRLVAVPGERVVPGQALVECSDPFLPAEIEVLASQLKGLEAIYDTQRPTDRVAAEITQEEIENVTAQLADARQRAEELTVRSQAQGTFVVPMAQDFPGRFVQRGELLGYVLDRSAIMARVVVLQAQIDLVRKQTRGVDVRFPERIAQSIPARVMREVPAATDQLPSRTLSMEGGGNIAIDPRDAWGTKSFQKLFLFDIELPTQAALFNVGGRVYVRFDHGREPLVYRWYREIRRVFLRRFNV